MKLTEVELIVKDMPAALAFYRALGLDIPPEADGQVHVVVHMDGGLTLSFDTLGFAKRFDPNWTQGSGPTNTLQFLLASREAVDDAYQRMASAGHLAPHDAFWGARYAMLEDPDGNVIGLQSPIDEDKKGPVS